jgi:hypothetical protein
LVVGLVALHFGAALGHHGGLVMTGTEDVPSTPLSWEQEFFSQGHRVKFLAEPREPAPGAPIRLVFEVQRARDGIYQGGLTPSIKLGTRGLSNAAPIPARELEGVIGYYEIKAPFPRHGGLEIGFEARIEKGKIVEGRFTKARSRRPFANLSQAALAAAWLLTGAGGLASIYRRRLS